MLWINVEELTMEVSMAQSFIGRSLGSNPKAVVVVATAAATSIAVHPIRAIGQVGSGAVGSTG